MVNDRPAPAGAGRPSCARRGRGSALALIVLALGWPIGASAEPAVGSERGQARRSQAAALCGEGQSEMGGGDLGRAVRLLEKGLALDPDQGDCRVSLGWARYRQGDFKAAARVFEEAAQLEPERGDAWAGLGYARLQAGSLEESEAAFDRTRLLDPDGVDAMTGMGLLYLRTRRPAQAAALLSQVVEKRPNDEEARAALKRALSESGLARDRRLRSAASGEGAPLESGAAREVRAADGASSARTGPDADPSGEAVRDLDRSAEPLSVPIRAGPRYIEKRVADGWRPLFVKGVNLGVALPGRFPSEFPEDEGLYRDWLAQIRAMNANVVRIYTLLPPAFYAALSRINREDPAAPVHLIQGVWVELPPEDDFSDTAWNREYAEEIRRVIDAVHGNIEVVPRPGHASGLYDADVSPWLMGMILGREWEPYAVEAYDSRQAARQDRPHCAFEGLYIRVDRGTPTECWIASTMEVAAEHQVRMYGESRPLAFTNWPTLDPLHHPTEATRAEEDAILRMRGIERPPMRGIVYENDSVAVDANAMAPTEAFPAGLFASYHAYPYYPDFMILDPGYLAHRDTEGPNAYAGYLGELVRYHAGRPVLISEVGVPTSRGVAHRQPQGFHHGGLNEAEQAAITSRLVRTVQETGSAGAIVFAWIDEWFKHNWLVADLEVPADRNPLWHNALDPEQHFGILAAAAGPAKGAILLDGQTGDWAGVRPVFPPRDGPIRALYASSDEAYLYLRLDVEPASKAGGSGHPVPRRARGASRVDSANATHSDAAGAEPPTGAGPAWTYWIGIDTYDRGRGSKRLPGVKGAERLPGGLEFAIRLGGDDPRIFVDAAYDIGGNRNVGPYASLPGGSGGFLPPQVEIRMERIGRDGTIYPAETHDLSPLRAGITDPRSPQFDSLADFFHAPEQGVFEIRIPWNLLNVTDPTTRRVVHQTSVHLPPIDTTVTDGFLFYVAAVPPGSQRVADERPARGEEARLFAWQSWEAPRYHLRRKAVYQSLKATFATLGPIPGEP